MRRRADQSGQAVTAEAEETEASEAPVPMSATRGLIESGIGTESVLLAGGNAAAERLVSGGGGQPIPDGPRADLEAGLGVSLAHVRVHVGDQATAMGARAYTLGHDIHFGPGEFDPSSADGYRLLAHETAHTLEPPSADGVEHARGSLRVGSAVAPAEREADRIADRLVARRGEAGVETKVAHAGPSVARRQIKPEDVGVEMIGQSMRTTGPHTMAGGTEAAGSTVTVVDWVNASTTARVRFAARPGHPAFEDDVPKTLLQPIRPSVAGVAPYDTNLPGQVASVKRGEAAQTAEQARPGGPRPGELPRLADLQRKREEALNRLLIEETMYNRFDPDIKQWVDHYNAQFGYAGPDALDPDLVKSMIFQESQMGTSGQHMEAVPSSPGTPKSRFNLAQVIDSSGAALLIMMQETEPTLITTYQLGSLRSDMNTAQRRFKDLQDKQNRTAAEESELATLTGWSEPNGSWETYFWNYRAAGAAQGFWEAVLAFFAPPAGGVSRQLDYEFWIRTAVRWLFEKRRSTKSWEDAIRAYNGGGQRARDYRDAVTRRAAGAEAAQQDGKRYVPGR